MNRSEPAQRYHALDSLRAFAMLLGLLIHAALFFKATNLGKYPIRDLFTHHSADILVIAIHGFRMQLFFLLLGFMSALLVDRKQLGGLLVNRFQRIVLPLCVFAPLLPPLMEVQFALYDAVQHNGIGAVLTSSSWLPDLSRLVQTVGPNRHLWFLYTAILLYLPALVVLALFRRPALAGVVSRGDAWFRALLQWRFRTPVLALATVPLLWGMRTWGADTPQGFTPAWLILGYYLVFFLFGWMLYRHRDLLALVERNWWAQLLAANVLVLPVMVWLMVKGQYTAAETAGALPWWFFPLKFAAHFLGAFYTWTMIDGLRGLFQVCFRTERPWCRYLADASYWCYLAGYPLQVGLEIWLWDEPIPGFLKYVLINVLSFGVLLLTYEWCVRYTIIGWLLNGPRIRPAATEPAQELANPGWLGRYLPARNRSRTSGSLVEPAEHAATEMASERSLAADVMSRAAPH